MTNLILFLNSFLSYLLVVIVFVLVAGIAVFAGIRLRKNHDKKETLTEASEYIENTKDTGAENEV